MAEPQRTATVRIASTVGTLHKSPPVHEDQQSRCSYPFFAVSQPNSKLYTSCAAMFWRGEAYLPTGKGAGGSARHDSCRQPKLLQATTCHNCC